MPHHMTRQCPLSCLIYRHRMGRGPKAGAGGPEALLGTLRPLSAVGRMDALAVTQEARGLR